MLGNSSNIDNSLSGSAIGVLWLRWGTRYFRQARSPLCPSTELPSAEPRRRRRAVVARRRLARKERRSPGILRARVVVGEGEERALRLAGCAEELLGKSDLMRSKVKN